MIRSVIPVLPAFGRNGHSRTRDPVGVAFYRSLIHEEVLPPAVIGNTDKLPDKSDMIGPAGLPYQLQAHLIAVMMPLFIVTLVAGADQILPGIFPSKYFGNNMINRHLPFFPTAILATAAIPLYYILAS